VRDAGQAFVQDGAHVVERNGTPLCSSGSTTRANWRADDPQDAEIGTALRRSPPEGFKILLAHRPELLTARRARHSAHPRGHIHGGQIYLPVIGWSAGRLIHQVM